MQQCLFRRGHCMQLLCQFDHTAFEPHGLSAVWQIFGKCQACVLNVLCFALKSAYVCAHESTQSWGSHHSPVHPTHTPIHPSIHSPTHPSTHPFTHPCNAGDHSRRQGRMAAAALPRKACRSARNLPLLCSGQWCDQQRVLAYCARHRGSVLGSVLLCWGSICGWTSLPRSASTCTAASLCFWLCSHPPM